MTKQEAMQQIEKEFSTAAEAQRVGNDGMVRVCARRAVGTAITFWLQSNPHKQWGRDAMSQLRTLQFDESMPQRIRDAAIRLTTKVNGQFAIPFSTNPIEDGKIIINHFLDMT